MNLWRISKIAALPDEGGAAPFRPVTSPATTGRRGRHDRSSRPRRIYISPLTSICLREFHLWNSRVPLLELGNSTAGTRIYSIFFSSTQRRRGAETRFLRVRKACPLTLSRECAGAHKRRKRQGLCSAEYAEIFLQAGIQINTQPVGLCDLPITACVAL